ncbi:sigma-70 family RNA polymerase sigma factor [Sinomicrobium weinanense]|uniref:Sigma-70 family RNA polymerase sigma factor n=1 Tax=Sinomicrobium weinanense TaxID=2842200 RepID=A0A926Q180_9FLAO|nr:sigma-70 family RNA polymerase sigma factor [Sinomicrobium weinanense]MBU3124059.1 sigma-70 family RNA polymerase sigma factor [Sinomicrobium weinanense]
MSLEELINRCKDRDRKAQEQLYRLFNGKLYSICLKYSRNQTEAEDNLQDSFMAIFNKIGQYRFKGSFEGWVRRVTVNTVLQKYRKEKVFNIVSEEIEDEVEVEIEDEDISLDYLLSIIQKLPDKYRLTFNLYVMDGYSHKEISEMLGVTEGTSKSNLSRARTILKTYIEEDHRKKKVTSL